MNTAIQCVVLLACMSVCSSASLGYCRCQNTVNFTRQLNSLITDVMLIEPRPYCRKEEVIVQLRNNKTVCLDTSDKNTKILVNKWNKLKKTTSPKANTTTTVSTTTTTSAWISTSATAGQTV